MIHFNDPKDKEILLHKLRNYPYTWYVYGNRCTDNWKKDDELILCYCEPIWPFTITRLEGELEGALPYPIRIVNWCYVPHKDQLEAEKIMYMLTRGNYNEHGRTIEIDRSHNIDGHRDFDYEG